jgi:pyranose oxidase
MIWIPVSKDRMWHVQMHGDGRRTQYGGAADVRMILDLGWFGMSDLNENNRITFDDDLPDRFGMPQITFDYELGDDDRVRAHDMMQEMLAAAEAVGGFLPPDGLPKFNEQGQSLHFQSTVRMGDNSEDSVVDTNSKVWGIDNLYLGTVGVIPTRLASNPTLTAVAIAAKGAHSIIGKDLPTDLAGI